MNRSDVVDLVVDLLDVDLDLDLVDVDLDVDLVDVDLVVFLSLAVFTFLGLLAPGCILGYWPLVVSLFSGSIFTFGPLGPWLYFRSLGLPAVFVVFVLWLFQQYFCLAVFVPSL